MKNNRSLSRPRSAALAVITALSLSACATLPSVDLTKQSNQADLKNTTQSFAAPQTEWPQDRWWTSYQDVQLTQLIEEALDTSPDMAIADARLKQAEAAQGVIRSAELPQSRASASATSQRQSNNYLFPKALVPQGWNGYGNAAIDFSWEIDFWGKNRAALAASTSKLHAARAETAQARLTLASAIASQYAELARLFAARETALQAIQVRSKTEQLFTERYEHGLENQHKVREAEANRLQAEAELLQIDENISILRHRLAALGGNGPDRGVMIERPKITLDRAFGLPEKLALELLGRRPDIVAARLQVEAQLKHTEQKKAEFYPNVNLSAFIGLQSYGLSKLPESNSTVGSVGPVISLPIFNGGRLRSELRYSIAQYDEAVANYQRTIQLSLQEVADAINNQASQTARVEKASRSVAAMQQAYRIVNERYLGGLSNYIEVLHAEDALLNAQKSLTDLQARAFTLDVAMIHALGGGYIAQAN